MNDQPAETPQPDRHRFWWDDHADRITALERRGAVHARILRMLCKEVGLDHEPLEQ
jgi:hypothetical protein